MLHDFPSNGNMFRVHIVSPDRLAFHGTESPGPHVQGQFLDRYPFFPQGFQHGDAEMQPGRRGCHRSFVLGIHRLIANLVILFRLPVQVWRDRDTPTTLQHFTETGRGIPGKFHDNIILFSKFPCRSQLILFSLKPVMTKNRSLFPFLQISDHTFPLALPVSGKALHVVRRLVRFQTENLDHGSRDLLKKNPGIDHLRVVKHQHLPGIKNFRHLVKMPLVNPTLVINQQLRRLPVFQWKLGNPFVGQIIRVILDPNFF